MEEVIKTGKIKKMLLFNTIKFWKEYGFILMFELPKSIFLQMDETSQPSNNLIN